ncbi:MAG: SRPBCC domain-containing protein [Vicinamibacterales bacterium]
MKAYVVTTSIRATPERVWALLTDAAGYVRWNNTVQKVDGKIALGERLTVHPKINPGRAFPVKVAEFQPTRRMVWIGRMPLGLFKGERTFTLTPGVNGEVEFVMREEYTGLMAPLISRSIPDLQPAFDEFARDLKHAAEAK